MNWLPVIGPILAALIAGGFGVFIALVAYPNQKRADRQLKLDEEKRAVFREYLRGIEAYLNYTAIADGVETAKIILQTKSSLNEISLFADQATILHMESLWAHATNFAMKMREIPFEERMQRKEEWTKDREDLEQKFRNAINAARHELELPLVVLAAEIAVLLKAESTGEIEQVLSSDLAEGTAVPMKDHLNPPDLEAEGNQS